MLPLWDEDEEPVPGHESHGCMAWCPQILNKRGCKVTIVALVWNDIQHFLFYVDQDKHVCDSSKLILFPHISQEFLLLPFSSGWDASQVSEKQKQRCPSRSRFGAYCSDISGAPCYHCNFGFIFPSHMKYHMKRIATKEKVICLFSVLLECGDVEL